MDYHFTAYAYLARRAALCAVEHPAGVGMGSFPTVCPVMVMSTYGGWADNMPAHNDVLEHFAEDGIAGGIAILWFMVAALIAPLSRPSTNSISRGALVSSVLFGLAGPIAFRLPFLALLAIEGNRSAGSLGVHDTRKLQDGKAQESS